MTMSKKVNTVWRGRRLRGALLASAACAVATGAIAQISEPTAPLRLRTDYFGWSASVSPRVSYSDNINLAPDGLEDDSLIVSNLFTGAAIVSTRRFTGIVSGDLDLSYFTADGGDFAVNQRIAGASTLTAMENLAYIDFAGSTSRQLLGENARFSQNINAARNQRANVHSYSASPYLYREFADQSNAQLRYRFSQVFIDDDRAGANPFGGGDFLNDSRSHEVIASYSTGQALERLRFTGTAYANRTVEDGSVIFPRFAYDQGTLMGEAQFALTSNFALSGAVGYDKIDTDVFPVFFDDDELSGFFWRAGFAAQPGRRTDIRVEYGRRYDDEFIDADVTYRLSEHVFFNARASQTFETRAQQINAAFFEQQRSTLEFAEQLREGAELEPENVIAMANRYANLGYSSQTTGVGVSKTASAQLRAAYDRTELAATAYYQDTDFGFRQNKAWGGNLDARRDLSRRLAVYGGLFYRGSEVTIDQMTCVTSPFLFGFDVNAPLFDPVQACLDFAFENGRTNTVGGRVGAAYRIYENLSAFGEYAHTNRFADSPLLEYSENAVVGGLILDF
jgi:uncharacterized protein (PEP-CTERM system associated)